MPVKLLDKTMTLGFVMLVASALPTAAEACGNFAHLVEEPGAESEVGDGVRHDNLLARIDRELTKSKAEDIFKCLLQDGDYLREFFDGEVLYFDTDMYQFVSSNYNYGKIILEDTRSEEYLAEKARPGLSILKPTFDFDKNGKPYLTNVFGFKKNADGSNSFYKYENGQYAQKNGECRECHADVPDELFFKSRFHRILN